jgi:hypothetical protein
VSTDNLNAQTFRRPAKSTNAPAAIQDPTPLNPRNLIETEEERVRREILKREKKGESNTVVGRNP